MTFLTKGLSNRRVAIEKKIISRILFRDPTQQYQLEKLQEKLDPKISNKESSMISITWVCSLS